MALVLESMLRDWVSLLCGYNLTLIESAILDVCKRVSYNKEQD